jgi:hypothetical protein
MTPGGERLTVVMEELTTFGSDSEGASRQISVASDFLR